MVKWGKIVWWPDRVDIGYKAMLIRADASPRDEIWRFIKTLVSIFLTKYKAWAYERDDMEELEEMCYTAAYCRLLRIVRTGQYRRDLSFYLNCRSAVLGTCFNTYKVWLRDMQERANLIDGTAPLTDEDHNNATYFDLKAADKVPKLRTDAEYKVKLTDWHKAIRKTDKQRILKETMSDDYSRYCEDCEELGVEPVDKIAFVCNSYTGEEHELLKYEPAKRTMYNRKYMQQLRSDPVRLERKRAYERAYHAKRKAEMEAKKKKTAT